MFRTHPTSRAIGNSGRPANRWLTWLWLSEIILIFIALSGCSPTPTPANTEIAIEIIDGTTKTSAVAQVGSSVQSVLQSAGITLGTLDRTDPPTFTLITAPLSIKITRVSEEYEVEETVIPFDRQTVRNESLPEGEELLIQPGQTGLQQTTYRKVIENGVQISRNVFKVTTITEPRSEIVMVGVQAPFKPIEIPGRLAYLTGGNAWLMETRTSIRKPILTTGDLDGRIFTLSTDGNWLLFTRKTKNDVDNINSLWAINLTTDNPNPINLPIYNVIHYAGWDPIGGLAIYYSTVEPRSTPPGWQANNDLRWLSFSSSGTVEKTDTIIETNSGGIYGWWGTQFFWSPDGSKLAYARSDSVGLVDFEAGETRSLINLVPFQTGSDWSWVPGVAWSSDGNLLYTVTHGSISGTNNNESSPLFSLSTFILNNGPLIDVVPQVGMFAYPVVSPGTAGEPSTIAYLQAIFPEQSENSRCRLALIDQDGSNLRVIFPPEGSAGLEPQHVAWAPNHGSENNRWIAFVNQGNIWLIDPATNQTQQITGDGLISRLDWK